MFRNVETSSKGYRRQNQSGMCLVPEFILLKDSIQTDCGPFFNQAHQNDMSLNDLTNDVILALM